MSLAAVTSSVARPDRRNEFVIGVPESQYMIPGNTYVGHLPGRSRKGFVRARYNRSIERVAVPAFGPNTFHQVERRTRMPRWLRSMFGSDYDHYDDPYRRQTRIYGGGPYLGASAGRPAPSTRQACSACGKFRSPSWSARNPLRYGEVARSNLCRKCMGKSTSSADTPFHPRRRRRHRFHRTHPRHSDYSDDLYLSHSSTDPYHPRRRYGSDSLGYIRPRSLVRPGSGERVNIVIRNEGCVPESRVRTVSSSDEVVHVIRRIAVDRPAHRHILRSVSSDPLFTDDVVEEVLPRRRPLSRARRRIRSSVHFVDDLEEPRYHRRPRNLSRHSSVGILESRSPHTSRLRRRQRPLDYDGAAEFQINSTCSDLDGAKEEEAIAAGRVGTRAIPGPSQKPPTSDESISFFMANHTYSPAELSTSTSSVSFSEGHRARVEEHSPRLDRNHDQLHICSSGAKTGKLTGRVRVAFADPEYEVDSQISSPPSVTYATLIPRPSGTPSPLYVHDLRRIANTQDSGRGRRYTEPLTPVYHDPEDSSSASRQKTSYKRVRPKSEPFSPPDSDQDPGHPLTSYASAAPGPIEEYSTTSMADNPDHPDHLAYLLSTAQLSQPPEQGGPRKAQQENDERINDPALFVDRSRDPDPCYYEHTKTGSFVSNLDGGFEVDSPSKRSFKINTPGNLVDRIAGPAECSHEPIHPHDHSLRRRNAMHDIFDADELRKRYHETQADYEAEGRAHM